MQKTTYLVSMVMTCLCTTMLIGQPDHAAAVKGEKESLKQERAYERELKKATTIYYREMTKANRAYHREMKNTNSEMNKDLVQACRQDRREMRQADGKIYREMAKNGRLAVKAYFHARMEALKTGRPLPPSPVFHSISRSQMKYLEELLKSDIVVQQYSSVQRHNRTQ